MLIKVLDGITTIEEIFRIVDEDDDIYSQTKIDKIKEEPTNNQKITKVERISLEEKNNQLDLQRKKDENYTQELIDLINNNFNNKNQG